MTTIDPILLAAAMGPLPEEFVWQPWGYLLEDEPTTEAEEVEVEVDAWQAANPPSLLGLCDDRTQFLSVRDFVMSTEWTPVGAR